MTVRLGDKAAAIEHRRVPWRTHTGFGISAAAYPHGRIAILLSRYPDLSAQEFNEVLSFVRNAQPSQLARLRSSEPVRDKLDIFLVEENVRLINPPGLLSWRTIAVFAVLLMCWSIWNKQQRVQHSPRTEMSAPSSYAVSSLREVGSNP